MSWSIPENSKWSPLSKWLLHHTKRIQICNLWIKIVILWNKFSDGWIFFHSEMCFKVLCLIFIKLFKLYEWIFLISRIIFGNFQKDLLNTLMLWMRKQFRGKIYPQVCWQKNHRLTLHGQKAGKNAVRKMTTKITRSRMGQGHS